MSLIFFWQFFKTNFPEDAYFEVIEKQAWSRQGRKRNGMKKAIFDLKILFEKYNVMMEKGLSSCLLDYSKAINNELQCQS